MDEELRQAVEDLKYKQRQYFAADEIFEETAYHELKAAQARVDALIKEAKEEKQTMKIWLRDEKTGLECGINKQGELFLGGDKSGSNLPDTPENREKIIKEFCRYTGRQYPVIAANGEPIKKDISMADFRL